jgi:hypothetical protein
MILEGIVNVNKHENSLLKPQHDVLLTPTYIARYYVLI